jgi:hypothetical protein
MVFVVIVLFLLALAACGVGFWWSCRLMFRGFRRIFAPAYGPPAGPRQDGPEMPATAPETVTVPGWSAKLVSDHLSTCSTCRESLVTYLLPTLEPEILKRVLLVIEQEDKAVAP